MIDKFHGLTFVPNNFKSLLARSNYGTENTHKRTNPEHTLMRLKQADCERDQQKLGQIGEK